MSDCITSIESECSGILVRLGAGTIEEEEPFSIQYQKL